MAAATTNAADDTTLAEALDSSVSAASSAALMALSCVKTPFSCASLAVFRALHTGWNAAGHTSTQLQLSVRLKRDKEVAHCSDSQGKTLRGKGQQSARAQC